MKTREQLLDAIKQTATPDIAILFWFDFVFDKYVNNRMTEEQVIALFTTDVEKGGPGSGNHGHDGRPGKHGGSLGGFSSAQRALFKESVGEEEFSTILTELNDKGLEETINTIGEEESVALYLYTGEASYSLNSKLRKTGDSEMTDSDRAFSAAISSGLEKLPNSKVVSYRGIRTPAGYTTSEEFAKQHMSGDSFVDTGFLSTADTEYWAQSIGGSFATGFLFEVQSDVAKDISLFHSGVTETGVEFLFDRNTKFDILAVQPPAKSGQVRVTLQTSNVGTKMSKSNTAILKMLTESDKARVDFLIHSAKGGPGSGNHGHDGRPGKHGGSARGAGSSISAALGKGVVIAARHMEEMVSIDRSLREEAMRKYYTTLDEADDESLAMMYGEEFGYERNTTNDWNIKMDIRDYVKDKKSLTDEDYIEIGKIVDNYSRVPTVPDAGWDYTAIYASRLRTVDGANMLYAKGGESQNVARGLTYFGATPEIRREFNSRGKWPSDMSIDEKTADYATFEAAFVKDWSYASNLPEQGEYKVAAQSLSDGYSVIYNRAGALGPIAPDPAVVARLQEMKSNTQAYFDKKGISEVTLYRGVSREVATHGAIESWTSSEGSAKKFDGHGVMERTVPVDTVLFTYQTLNNWPEKEVMGKKEYGLLGNRLN